MGESEQQLETTARHMTGRQPRALLEVIDPSQLLDHISRVQELVKGSLVEGEDFLQIPGTPKPSLMQPGAEKLGLAAQLTTHFERDTEYFPNGHLKVESRCDLVNPEGRVVGTARGICSTLEPKYRYRYESAPCPSCGESGTIMRSKYPSKERPQEPPGWYCNPKKGGCGSSFPLSYGEFNTSKVENQDPAGEWNTVSQMADKRAHVAAIKRTLGISGLFTMDMEDKARQTSAPAATSRNTRRRTGAQRRPAARSRSQAPSTPPEPPVEAYEGDAGQQQLPAARGNKATENSTISPEKAAELGAKAGQDTNFILATVGWDGPLLQMPARLIEKFENELKKGAAQ